MEQRDGVYEKISQYLQLKNTIKRIQVDYILLSCHFCSYYLQISNRYLYLVQETGSKELKTDVDLGCSFFVQAHVWVRFLVDISDTDGYSEGIRLCFGISLLCKLTKTECLLDKKKKKSCTRNTASLISFMQANSFDIYYNRLL